MKIARFLGFCLLLGPAVAVAESAEPVALVLDVQGEVSPSVEPFSELVAGTELTLGPGAVLTVEHYAGCEEVTIHGGAVLVGAKALELAATGFAMRQPIDCPQVIQLSEATINAGVILRSVDASDLAEQKVGLTPVILFAGGGGINSLRIEQGGSEVAAMAVSGGRADWPEDAPALSDGGRYRLVLSDGWRERWLDVVANGDTPAQIVLRLAPPE